MGFCLPIYHCVAQALSVCPVENRNKNGFEQRNFQLYLIIVMKVFNALELFYTKKNELVFAFRSESFSLCKKNACNSNRNSYFFSLVAECKWN